MTSICLAVVMILFSNITSYAEGCFKGDTFLEITYDTEVINGQTWTIQYAFCQSANGDYYLAALDAY